MFAGMGTSYKPRKYYSVRTGTNPSVAQLGFADFKSLFRSGYEFLAREAYFNEAFGFWCIDEGDVPGSVGSDVAGYVLLSTRKHLWPIDANIERYTEEDIFDLIEFLFDHVSKPTDGSFHSYGGCGMHWHTFDKAQGQSELRDRVNILLESYGPGYALNEVGEIMELAPDGLGKLLNATPPTKDADALARMKAAIDRFQRYGSSIEDRRHAVADLAAVLEKLRPQVKEALHRKDEDDLFNLANNFGIRHFNDKQKTDYDLAVWLSWMFYFYLATINAFLHILERKEKAGGVA
jgi:hypothetical protein